jgi:hypothetical protein
MNPARVVVLTCSLLFLHGCFDKSDNETKNNTDGSKSSVQMQQSDSNENSNNK